MISVGNNISSLASEKFNIGGLLYVHFYGIESRFDGAGGRISKIFVASFRYNNPQYRNMKFYSIINSLLQMLNVPLVFWPHCRRINKQSTFFKLAAQAICVLWGYRRFDAIVQQLLLTELWFFWLKRTLNSV